MTAASSPHCGGGRRRAPAPLLEAATFETWVISGRDPARLAELLEHGTTVGTRVA
jgi:hypothetical protein